MRKAESHWAKPPADRRRGGGGEALVPSGQTRWERAVAKIALHPGLLLDRLFCFSHLVCPLKLAQIIRNGGKRKWW
jgi:hypothetical protein